MKIREDLIYREEDGVIFDTTKGELHELNDSANDIINTYINSQNYDEMVARLLFKYNQSTPDEVHECINETMAILKQKGLLNE